MSSSAAAPNPEVDLAVCETEPIRIPGSIQSHGVLIALDGNLRVTHASANIGTLLQMESAAVLGHSFKEIIGVEAFQRLEELSKHMEDGADPILLDSISWGATLMNVLAHRTGSTFILDIEPPHDAGQVGASANTLNLALATFISKIHGVEDITELSSIVAKDIRAITNFDRVLVYRFDADGTGFVVAEDGNGNLPCLENHRFPASDIPTQARQLYRLNRLRIIPDSGYEPIPIHATDEARSRGPLDLSRSTLRSVSPVHVEYMRNMRTRSSMSISILVDEKLWGLISCHHTTPQSISFGTRTACELLTQVYSLQVAARQSSKIVERRVELKSILPSLLTQLAETDDFAEGVKRQPKPILDFMKAGGCALVTRERCDLFGNTPNETQVRALVEWLISKEISEVFFSDCLSKDFPAAFEYSKCASGVLSVIVSQRHATVIIWFRPEILQTIQWGGDPSTAKIRNPETGRIHPRQSFDTWSETVRNRSAQWLTSEIEAAAEFRSGLLGIVLRRTEELSQLNKELSRSNKELEAFSYSVSHDLRAPLRHIAGFAEMLKEAAAGKLDEEDLKHADTIIDSSEYAGKLIDSLLSFSRMGRSSLDKSAVDMNLLVAEVVADVGRDFPDRTVNWIIKSPLPTIEGDSMMLKLAVRNLLSNAVKYTRTVTDARVEISSEPQGSDVVFKVFDNGVGFDMRYVDKLFGVFQRLHRWEDYEGTGIGLANVRRIVERHGGRTWAEGKVNQGATFYFSLPLTSSTVENRESE